MDRHVLHIQRPRRGAPIGLHLRPRKKNPLVVEVEAVESGSPAEKAGVKPKDLITDVGGKAFLADPDIHAAVTVLRNLPASFDVAISRKVPKGSASKVVPTEQQNMEKRNGANQTKAIRSPLGEVRNTSNLPKETPEGSNKMAKGNETMPNFMSPGRSDTDEAEIFMPKQQHGGSCLNSSEALVAGHEDQEEEAVEKQMSQDRSEVAIDAEKDTPPSLDFIVARINKEPDSDNSTLLECALDDRATEDQSMCGDGGTGAELARTEELLARCGLLEAQVAAFKTAATSQAAVTGPTLVAVSVGESSIWEDFGAPFSASEVPPTPPATRGMAIIAASKQATGAAAMQQSRRRQISSRIQGAESSGDGAMANVVRLRLLLALVCTIMLSTHLFGANVRAESQAKLKEAMAFESSQLAPCEHASTAPSLPQESSSRPSPWPLIPQLESPLLGNSATKMRSALQVHASVRRPYKFTAWVINQGTFLREALAAHAAVRRSGKGLSERYALVAVE